MSEQTILIVEDNEKEQKLMAMLAHRAGYVTEIVATGDKALQAIAGERRYGAVLMNWLLPGMDGLECAQRIREFEYRQGALYTPIIAVTAKALWGEREQCLRAGMDDYLSKPYTIDQFTNMLRKWAPTTQGHNPLLSIADELTA